MSESLVPGVSSGNYNNQVCVGGFMPTIQDLFRTNSPHGLCLNSAYMYGSLYDEDGCIYNYMRNVGPESLHVVYYYTKKPGEVFIIPPEANDMYLGMCVNRIRGDKIKVHSWNGIPRPGFSLVIDPDSLHLIEEGKMELTGKRVGLSMNTYFPQQGEDIYYSSVIYEVEGMIMGKNVYGGMAWDQYYGPAGQNWQTMRIFNEVQHLWVSGINVYDNGDKEMYHFTAGKGDWGLGFVTSKDEKITTITRTVKSEIIFGDDGDPIKAIIKAGSEDWEWNGVPKGRMNPKSLNLPMIWVEGPTLRVGEKRWLMYGGGWFETYPLNLKK